MKIFLSYESSAIILTVCLYVSVVFCSSNDDDLRSLHKRLKDKYEEDNGKKPPHHLGPPMGVLNEDCDDGVHGIEIDWDPSSSKEYTCLPTDRIENTAPAKEIHQDKDVTVYHICLDKHVHYKTPLPLSGDHRPLWAKYGEYRYIPPPRWVHNLEHGAVILLYHPCMKGSDDVEKLKKIVKGCLRKHIITPYRKVPHSHPFALLTYHHGLLLSHFDVKDKSQLHRVVNFIKRYAQQSPEAGVWGNGQYSIGLRHRSHTVSDKNDSNLCPKYHRFR